jgi:protein-disulfide isomerase
MRPVLPNRDHIRGPAFARVTLLEYGDYECPYCSVAHASFVFRHFPITTVHPHAHMAAEAAEAPGSQGEFWPS